MPGVLVVARTSGGLTAEAVADGAGIYRFPSLRPDTYELSLDLDGFAPVRITNVALTLGRQLRIDLVLVPAGLNETVNVTAPSPLLAVSQSVRATSLRGDDIEKMPRGRDFISLAVGSAGASNEPKLGGVGIDGSTGAENRIVLDGIETTDTWLGTPGQFLVTDFVEEFQLKSSGYSAEYGGSTGGVVNVITRNGGNVWYREALLYWSGDVLDATSRQVLRVSPTDASRAEYVTYADDNYDQLEPGFTVGGPLARDRVWMFGGYVPSLRDTVRSVIFPRRLVRHSPSTVGAAPRDGEHQCPVRLALARTRYFQLRIPAAGRAAASTGRQRQPEREFRDRRCHGELFDLALRRRHPEYAIVFRPESGIFLSESLQRGGLSRRPVSLPDPVAQSAGCPQRVPARALVHERAVE